jgi:hypothetical protein
MVRVIAVLVITCRVAFAGSGVGLIVAGEPSLQDRVRGDIKSWIERHGYNLDAIALSDEASHTLSNCFVIEDPACARGEFEHQSRADQLVYVRIDLGSDSAKGRNVGLAGYWLIKGRETVADRQACEPCTNVDLSRAVDTMMTALFKATGLKMGRIRVAEPIGLTMFLDGGNVGLTPLELDVKPGVHTIVLRRNDNEVGRTSVTVAIGDILTVPIKTTPIPEDRPSRIAPGLLILGGVGAMITGAVFVYYGERNSPNDYLIYPDATKQGILIGSIGGAALVAGLIWWWHGSSTPKNGPTALLGSDTMGIGWSGRF